MSRLQNKQKQTCRVLTHTEEYVIGLNSILISKNTFLRYLIKLFCNQRIWVAQMNTPGRHQMMKMINSKVLSFQEESLLTKVSQLFITRRQVQLEMLQMLFKSKVYQKIREGSRNMLNFKYDQHYCLFSISNNFDPQNS